MKIEIEFDQEELLLKAPPRSASARYLAFRIVETMQRGGFDNNDAISLKTIGVKKMKIGETQTEKK